MYSWTFFSRVSVAASLVDLDFAAGAFCCALSCACVALARKRHAAIASHIAAHFFMLPPPFKMQNDGRAVARSVAQRNYCIVLGGSPTRFAFYSAITESLGLDTTLLS